MKYTKIKQNQRSAEAGFTLIELSIVLVIIGLIIGGVLVGQDLIRAAEVRATISQIEKYNTAVNTFRGKFNAVPGDMNASTTSTFGFASGGTRGATGQGDGNGVIDGGSYASANTSGANWYQSGGETGVFWVDLSSSTAGNLIDGGFSAAVETAFVAATLTGTGTGAITAYLPQAKLGRGNFIYVFENGGVNYFGMSAISAISSAGVLTATGTVSVAQAYNIDKKVDDGVPSTGNVQEGYVTSTGTTLANDGQAGASATKCYDSTAVTYNMGTNNGGSAVCALYFKFQ